MDDTTYLTHILEGLVEYPEAIRVSRTVDEKGVLLEVSVDKADMGKVIGKGGATAQAIRNIMRSFGKDSHISLKFIDP